MGRIATTALVALVTAIAVAAPATAAPAPVSGVNVDVSLNERGFLERLAANCTSPRSDAPTWVQSDRRSPFRFTRRYRGALTSGLSGSADLAPLRADVTSTGRRGLRFGSGARALRVGAFGLTLRGETLVVTGRIERRGVRGPRLGLLRLQGARVTSGLRRRDGRALPNSFAITLEGTATVEPAFARALSRARCRSGRSRAVRRGARFGVLRAELLPDAAAGLGGMVVFGAPGPKLQNASGAVTVAPTGAVRPAFNGMVADLPADRRTPLKCHTCDECAPAPRTPVPLGGGFTLSQGGRSVELTDLAFSYEGREGPLTPTLTGTLAGARIVVQRDTALTDDFRQRVAAALGGGEPTGSFGRIGTTFERIAAP